MDSMPCPICGECQWDVDDCIEVAESLSVSWEHIKLFEENKRLKEQIKLLEGEKL